MKPINVALGSSLRTMAANPSFISPVAVSTFALTLLCERCASSLITIMSLRDVITSYAVALALFKQFIQVIAVICLDWLLSQIVATSGKGAVQLVVEVETVSEHKYCRAQQIFEQLVGIENHRQTLTTPLHVPEHADFAVFTLQRFLCAFHRFLHGEKLVIVPTCVSAMSLITSI